MDTPTNDKNPPISAPEAVNPTIGDKNEANMDTNKGNSQTSVFINSQPMREDQIENAVKFLSHPKVRGSAVMYRRSFLERKGLTTEEIDEAFRRVPDPSPSASAVQPTTSTQDNQMKPVSNAQPQVNSQIVGVNPKKGVLSQFHWTHALAAIGVLAISGAGTAVIFKRSIVPRLKSWIRKVVLEEEEAAKKIAGKPSLEEEAAAAAKAAAAAASDVARAIQEMLISKSEEKKHFEELMSLVGTQVQEMKSMSNAIKNLEGNTAGRISLVEQEQRVSVSNARGQLNVNGTTDYYSGSSPLPSNAGPSAAPHPQSYMDIMAMIQRGEKPSNIREINDMPPNPNQPLPTPQLAPRPKPWEVGQTQSSFPQSLQYNESSNGINYNIKDNGFANQTNGDSEVPWWQKKNVRISEMENDEGLKTVSSEVATKPPVQRSWVPPQPPPVAIPESAAAIRQPKKPISQKSLTDDELLAGDELQRITKISETGGALDTNISDMTTQSVDDGSSGVNISEIQEEQEAY